MNICYALAKDVDPATHLILPLLILLAAKRDPKLVVPLSIFAVLPDFDSLLGPHREVFHNVFVTVLIPLAFIAYARLKKPQLIVPGLIVMFYLVSHDILDLSGVALLYPIDPRGYFFVPTLYFYTAPSLRFDLVINWGASPITQHNEYEFVSQLGFAFIFLIVIIAIVFRSEMKQFAIGQFDMAKMLWDKFKKSLSRR